MDIHTVQVSSAWKTVCDYRFEEYVKLLHFLFVLERTYIIHEYIYNNNIAKDSELAFVHLFDLQICFVGVFPTRQDLNDNVNSLAFSRVPLE